MWSCYCGYMKKQDTLSFRDTQIFTDVMSWISYQTKMKAEKSRVGQGYEDEIKITIEIRTQKVSLHYATLSTLVCLKISVK